MAKRVHFEQSPGGGAADAALGTCAKNHCSKVKSMD